jgi:HAD superfamily hydrolase (TIGR01509 family)
MDGVIVDSEPLWFDVEREFLRVRGCEWTPDLARECTGRGLVHAVRSMYAAFDFPYRLEEDMRTIVDAFASRIGELRLKAGVASLLDGAVRASVPRAVASSSMRRLIDAILHRFVLSEHFDAVVSGDSLARPKPAPDIFLEAARQLRVPPEHCIVLEDSLAGVLAARAAGIRVIAIPERQRESFVGVADAVVSDLTEARSLLAV